MKIISQFGILLFFLYGFGCKNKKNESISGRVNNRIANITADAKILPRQAQTLLRKPIYCSRTPIYSCRTPKYCRGSQYIHVGCQNTAADANISLCSTDTVPQSPEPLMVFTSLRVITYFQNAQIGNDETKNINSRHPALDAGSVGDLK